MENPYRVGDRVLAPAGDGGGRAPATVVDSYSLIMGGETKPMVCVELAGGERLYLGASEVEPAEPAEESGAEG